MACQISSHRGVGDESIVPKDVHGDLSSNNSTVAAGNSLISSGLKFGTNIFKDLDDTPPKVNRPKHAI